MAKTYFCTNSMKLNLDSMITLVLNLKYDFENGITTGTVRICDRDINEDTVYDLLEELYDLYGKALHGKVTSAEYGRIKSIQTERQFIRYNCCLAAGMSEHEAGLSFTD